VRAALRRRERAGTASQAAVRFDDVVVDLSARRVTKAGADVHLTQIEFRLLSQLLAEPGRVLTHRHLLREVWGPSHADDSHYLRIYMANLRRKLEDDPARPRYLLTETGVGYRFQPD
jgi:two-component system KDP operon response regulator KdpE